MPRRSAMSGSLFGDARLVVVEGVDGRRNADGRLANGWKAADVKAIEAYLASPAPGHGARARRRGAEEGRAADEGLREGGRGARVRGREAERQPVGRRPLPPGGRARRARCVRRSDPPRRARTSTSSRTRSTSSRSGPADEPIGEREVEPLVAAVAETPTFALTDAWAQRDTGRTLAASETIFEREGRPRRDTAPRLAGALANHLVVHAPLPAARGRGRAPARRGGEPEAASVLRREGLRAGGELLATRSCATARRPAGRARPCAQGRQQAARRISSSSER